ncbi:MAG: hypothetical protein EOP34_06175 [Rickettsiales bacterium]|nr:MAG: hypothetical protein EOP34_06175 [Rickettsiales bacterium]
MAIVDILNEQRKYNICKAFEKISQGEKFSFASISSLKDKKNFSEFIKSFKHITEFYNKGSSKLEKNLLEKIDHNETLTEYLAEYCIFKNRGMWIYNKDESKTYMPCGNQQFEQKVYDVILNKFEAKFLYYFKDWIDQITSDLTFCSDKASHTIGDRFTFEINYYEVPNWHHDGGYSDHREIGVLYTPFGKSTLFANVTGKEAQELMLSNIKDQPIDVKTYNATNDELSFHTMLPSYLCDIHPVFGIQPFNCDYRLTMSGDNEAIHRSPTFEGTHTDIDRLFISLPPISISGLSEHLAKVKQETIVKYNIPESEFNWENITLYGVVESKIDAEMSIHEEL